MGKRKTIFKDKSGYFVEQNGQRIYVKPTDQKGQDESKWTFTDGSNTYTPSKLQEKRAEYSSAYDPYALTDLLDWTAENTIGLPIKWTVQTEIGQKAIPYVGKILSVAQPSKWYGTFTGKGAPWSEKNTGFGDSKHDKSLNTLVDWALSPALLKGEGAIAKSVGSKTVRLAKPHIVGMELLKAAKRWDGTVRDVLPAKRIDLTPQTYISKQQVNTPFKGQLRNYLTESGESIIYDDGQYVLKEKSLYDVNSSIDKLYHNVSRDLAMNKIPGIQPIEYLGYKVNTNPQKIVNGLTGEIETKLNKTYDPIYRQRKIIPLNDPKTIFLDQPTSHKLLDHYGIKHDKDFGYVGGITFSDFGLKNWGIDDYGRYRLFDPMIHDF